MATATLSPTMEKGKATRDAFGRALEALGEKYPDLVVVDADVGNSTRTEWFGKKYPDRYIAIGIAESNQVGIAGGLASAGKTPLIASFAAFIMCNGFDQLRMSVAYPKLNVKVVGSHAGVSIGEDGASQMGIEDLGLACSMPNFVVVVPADEASARAATEAMIAHQGPVYLRTGRPGVPKIYSDDATVPFTFGKANRLRDGDALTIIANGLTVAPALKAAETLAGEGVQARVLDMHTLKPIDQEAIAEAARETGALVVCEEHLEHGGLGSIVAVAAAKTQPVPIRFVNVGDRYGESGTPDQLIERFGLTAPNIAQAARDVLQAKNA